MLASYFFLISNNSEIGLGWRSLPLVPVSISCTCKHQLNLHASKEIYSVRVKWILLLEIVQVEYFFDKFIVNFHALLLILHVFQVDMIYMYHNSDIVSWMFPADHFWRSISKWNSTSIQWQANGSNTYFFFQFRCLVQSVCFIWNAKIKKTPYVNNFIGCFQSIVCVSFQISGITCTCR